MSVHEVIDLAMALSGEDQDRVAAALQKRRLERVEQEFAKLLEGVKEIPIYTPFDTYEAAAALEKFLTQEKARS
jgi:hypothetical protein